MVVRSVDERVSEPQPTTRRSTPTPRQIEVLQLICDGHTEKTAAKTLGLSLRTVKSHVFNVLREQRAEHRTHAVAIGFRDGWLS